MNKLIHGLLLQFFEDVEASVPMSKETLKEHKKIAEYLRQGKFEEASRGNAGHINRVSRQIAEKSKQQSLLGKPK